MYAPEEIDGLERQKERLLARMEIIEQLQKSRPEIVHLFDEMVEQHGFDRAYLEEKFSSAKRLDHVLESIAKPAEKELNWGQYRPIFVTTKRTKKGNKKKTDKDADPADDGTEERSKKGRKAASSTESNTLGSSGSSFVCNLSGAISPVTLF